MYRDFTEGLAFEVLAEEPIHPDPVILAELTAPGAGCGAHAPYTILGGRPYRCSRTPHHSGQHVAGTSAEAGTYIAEWDEDRSTDLGDAS